MLDKVNPIRAKETQQNTPSNKEEALGCIFYKGKKCNPMKLQFKLCQKCHKSKVMTFDKSFKSLFEKIISMAFAFMSAFGLSKSENREGLSKRD